MATLYLNEQLDAEAVGDEVSVVGAEARHAVTVGRARVGERLSIGNGRGLIVRGSVLRAHPDELAIGAELIERVAAPSPRILLAQALAKGDRDELAVQAATELGIDAIIPWAAARSVSRWDERKAVKGRERWASIAREATKQSLRAWLPDVLPLAGTRQLAELARTSDLLVLEPTAEAALSAVEIGRERRDLVIVVGPEGGIAPEELAAFTSAGARTARLGDSVLRTSTAGPAALAVLAARLGRW